MPLCCTEGTLSCVRNSPWATHHMLRMLNGSLSGVVQPPMRAVWAQGPAEGHVM